MDFLNIPVRGSRWEGYDHANGADAILICGGGTGWEAFLIALRLRNVVSSRFTVDGAVALVAPGAKRRFETGLGGGRERRLVLPLILGR
jgi:hypothetical protein